MLRIFGLWLFIYGLTGAFGALWISDSFDMQRSILYGGFVLPCFIVYYFFFFSDKNFLLKNQFFSKWIFFLLGLTFSWGNILLLNALSSSKKTSVRFTYKDLEQDRAMTVAMKRGGLGMLYRFRW